MSSTAAVSLADLTKKIETRQARIGIVGMGYVGLPLALLFSNERFRVTGFDIESRKVETLNNGGSYIVRILPDAIKQAQKSGFVATSDYSAIEAMDVIIEKAGQIPVPTCNLVLEHFHGAVNRVPRDATAFVERGAAYNVAIVGVWQDKGDAERCIAWARGVYDALHPWSTGSVYVNYLGVGDEPERVKEAFGANYDRLVGVKQKYDPDNLFRANQNISPRA